MIFRMYEYESTGPHDDPEKMLQKQHQSQLDQSAFEIAEMVSNIFKPTGSMAMFIVVMAACLYDGSLAFSPVSFSTCPSSLRFSHLFMSSDDTNDDENQDPTGPSSTNVLGTSLQPCCADVRGTGIGTGFYRNGYCSTGEQDLGRHTACVQVTDEFLEFSAAAGNDLSTPMPEYMFPGLKDGDIWCLCAQRWVQAYQAGKAPKLFLQATHEKTLDYVPFKILREYALDKDEADRRLDDLNEQRERLKKLL